VTLLSRPIDPSGQPRPRPNRRRHRRSTAAALAAVACLASACGFSHGTTLNIGLRRVGVNLAFANGQLNPPPVIEHIVVPAGVGPSSMVSDIAFNNQTYYPPVNQMHFAPAFGVCKKAPAGAVPTVAAPAAVSTKPKAGTYLTHETGKFNLADGNLKLGGQVPPYGVFEIAKVSQTTASGGLTAVTGTQNITWQVIAQGLGTITTTTYEATNKQLELVSQTVNASSKTYSFTPTPAVEIMGFGGVGSSWHSVGVDHNSGTVMTVSGSILAEQPVDVCGTMYDSYKVQSSEQITNVTAGVSSQTSSSDPNIYWVATEFGGLFLAQHIDETETIATSPVAVAFTGGAAITLSLDYTSTLSSVTPVKKS